MAADDATAFVAVGAAVVTGVLWVVTHPAIMSIVTIFKGTQDPVPGQLSDLQIKDMVKVTYDEITKNVTMISIARVDATEK